MTNKNTETNAQAQAQVVDKKMPLFKYEPDEKNTGMSHVVILGAVIFAFCVVLYFLGTFYANSVLTLLAMVLLVCGAILIFAMRRKIQRVNKPLDEKTIDEQVEQYKRDLVETFIGYDVEYTTQDILDAADKYRERLIMENTSVSEIDPTDIRSVIQGMQTDAKNHRKNTKQLKKQEKEAKKAQKAAKKHLN
jgi:Ca2+/Na+ antiporter